MDPSRAKTPNIDHREWLTVPQRKRCFTVYGSRASIAAIGLLCYVAVCIRRSPGQSEIKNPLKRPFASFPSRGLWSVVSSIETKLGRALWYMNGPGMVAAV